MKIAAVIPARYASSRFPGKPLAAICHKPMIQWVYETVCGVPEITETIVATDDERIHKCVLSFGGTAVLTGDCSCGTDRVYEAVKEMDCDLVLNVQGDEPFIKTQMIQQLIHAFEDPKVAMATLKKEISYEQAQDPHTVKVITDRNGHAIYFSRYAIPYQREQKIHKYYKHIGIYAYTKPFLHTFVHLPKSSLEKAESLEQLRALDNGCQIKVLETAYDSFGVDLPEHVQEAEKMVQVYKEQMAEMGNGEYLVVYAAKD